MKRLISAILCVVMLLCILPMSVFAQDKATPLILVQGYSGPSLFYDLGGENEHQVWGINMDDLKKIVIARIPELAGGLAGAAFGDYERLVKVVGEAGVELLEPLRCNPDGTSKYDLSVYPEGAANTRASVLKAKGEDKYIAEKRSPPISSSASARRTTSPSPRTGAWVRLKTPPSSTSSSRK